MRAAENAHKHAQIYLHASPARTLEALNVSCQVPRCRRCFLQISSALSPQTLPSDLRWHFSKHFMMQQHFKVGAKNEIRLQRRWHHPVTPNWSRCGVTSQAWGEPAALMCG